MFCVSIIGFGKFGRALADVAAKSVGFCRGRRSKTTEELKRKKPQPKIYGWDIVDTGDPRQTHSPTLIRTASVIFIAVPSEHFSKGLTVLKNIPKTALLVTCTKGFDKRTGKLPIEVLRQRFPLNPLAVLSGPTLSQELGDGLPVKAIIASRSPRAKELVKNLLHGTNLVLESTNDVIGVSFCGILKNVYALALGLADGLGLGSNFKSCLASQALKEMAAIITQSGGKKETLWTSAGIADFLTTGYSDKSRNYTYGFKKARGENLTSIMAEGVKSLKITTGRIKNYRTSPLLSGIGEVFLKNKDPRRMLVRILR